MKQTISILLNNRFSDAERLIGLFSASGYRIEKILLLNEGDKNLSRLLILTDSENKNLDNFLTRLRQQVRVVKVESTEGDALDGRLSVSEQLKT
ncbi:MAG TPA: acetolactate synthase small subunit [Pyrinomonadaceae bacterium]|nr:acetolactate synthase small subunit [Pyrinomonadaceae bacterium]